MKKPKAIFMDMDGTLLSFTSRKIPMSALSAFSKAREMGILLFVATGRHHSEVKIIECIKDEKFDGFVTQNGAYCYTDEKVIYKSPIPKETIRAFVDVLELRPFPCLFCEEGGMFINMTSDHVKRLQKKVNVSMPPICDPKRALDVDIYQLVPFITNPSDYLLMESLPGIRITKWMDGGFDAVSETVNKWVGILEMIKHFNITPEETAAIGDAENDIEMLLNAGFSVAMGNAGSEVKESAKYITDHIDNDGLAKAFDYLLGM